MTVSAKGLEMSKDKVQTIQEWPAPTSIKEVQAFLGFANFFRRFKCDYSNVAMPLIALIQENQPFLWIPQANVAFQKLQSKFIQAPILLHPNFERPFIVEIDTSNTAIGAILSQYGEDKQLHPCAY